MATCFNDRCSKRADWDIREEDDIVILGVCSDCTVRFLKMMEKARGEFYATIMYDSPEPEGRGLISTTQPLYTGPVVDDERFQPCSCTPRSGDD